MTYQWAPPPQQQPSGGGGGNGLVYALIGLVAVLAVVLGVVAFMAFGGGADGNDSSANVADAGQMQAPPAPAGQPEKPKPTGAAARETVTQTVDSERGGSDGGDSSRGGSGSRNWWDPDSVVSTCDGGARTGSSSTSCAFADRVYDRIWAGNLGAPHRTVRAYSPVTGQTYTMSCTLGTFTGTDASYRCTGGNNAVVYVGVAG